MDNNKICLFGDRFAMTFVMTMTRACVSDACKKILMTLLPTIGQLIVIIERTRPRFD